MCYPFQVRAEIEGIPDRTLKSDPNGDYPHSPHIPLE